MRLKRKVKKLFTRASEWTAAQWHYSKEFCSKVASALKAVSSATTKLAVVIATLAALALCTERVHSTYVENKVSASVVFITSTPESLVKGSATGFHITAKSGKTFIVTNAHVCGLRDAHNIVMVEEKLHTGRLVPRRVIEVYPDNDLCLVEALENYPALEMGTSLSRSDRLMTIGYPLGQELNISKGRVKGFRTIAISQDIPLEQCKGKNYQIKEIMWFFLTAKVCQRLFESAATDIATFPGNSGSPAVNWLGQVVAVVFASDMRTNWGYLVPLKDLKLLLDAH